jgi:hypothetical protein
MVLLDAIMVKKHVLGIWLANPAGGRDCESATFGPRS